MPFDVAIAFILMVRGVPLPYVVTLLCTLGAFSIYSVLILGRTMSWRIAASFFGAVMLLRIAAGIGTETAATQFLMLLVWFPSAINPESNCPSSPSDMF
jgi:hypothetical protein